MSDMRDSLECGGHVLATSGVRGDRSGEEVPPEERVGDEIAEQRGRVRNDDTGRRHRNCHVCSA
jgi:hypothetical protein